MTNRLPRARHPRIIDLYARESKRRTKLDRSVAGQLAAGRAEVEARPDCVVGEELKDPNKSAWRKGGTRPDFDRLVRRLTSGESDGVYIYDISRFSRRSEDGVPILAAAERGLLVLSDTDELDLTTPAGRKTFRDLLSSAEYESDMISKRSARGKRFRAMQGESNASWRSFGNADDGQALRAEEARELRRVAGRILAGESASSQARALNDRGVLTSRGNLWTSIALRKALTRPSSAGLVEYKGEIVGETGGDAVLDRETWERLVALFASRRRGRPISERYLASGVALCGLCGHTLNGRVRTTSYPNGERKRAYACVPRETGVGCGHIAIDMRMLDEYLREFTVARLADARVRASLQAQAAEAAAAVADVEEQLAQIEATLIALAQRLGRGEMSLERHDAAAGPLEARAERLAARRAEIVVEDPRPTVRVPAVADRAAVAALWADESATTAQRRGMLVQALGPLVIRVMPAVRGAGGAARVRIEGRTP